MVKRLYYNGRVLGALFNILVRFPELRFCQLLSILELDKDNFYEEPDKTLRRIYESDFFKN